MGAPSIEEINLKTMAYEAGLDELICEGQEVLRQMKNANKPDGIETNNRDKRMGKEALSTEQMKVESMELLAHMDRAISSGEKLVSRMENLKKPAGNKTRLRKRDIERGLLEYLDALDRQLESYEDLISLTKNRSALGHDHCFRALKDARKSAKITRKLAGAGAIVATTLVGAGIGAVAGPLGILAVGFASGLTATLFAVIGGAFRPDLLDALEVSVKSATTVKASLKSIYG